MTKSQSAVELGRKRWVSTTPEQRAEYMAALRAKRKGRRTWTPEQRAEIARRLAAGRAAAKARRTSGESV